MQWSIGSLRQPDPNSGFRLKVQGDGTPWGTFVTDALTGARLWNVESIIIQCRPNEAPAAVIRVSGVELDLQATVDRTQPATVANEG